MSCGLLLCDVRSKVPVQVRILIGYWNYSMPVQYNYLLSLDALPNVEVRYFLVPGGSQPRLHSWQLALLVSGVCRSACVSLVCARVQRWTRSCRTPA
jgi:hypothetical protein